MDGDRWRRAAAVFEAALDQPESERRSYVERACAGDDELLREVEALIDEDRRASTLDVPLGPEVIADLSSIRKVGSYTFQSPLGVGGMGEVYRARDTRLGRDVAIKILPAAFAGDRDRLARFAREAQMLASLNHPNIASIYGIESEGVTEALVLELVEGPTLADRIAPGALPIEEAIAIACQIAEALTAAHDAGIVHRDLKPANVKVRADGVVKVLDFGLAKIGDATRSGGVSPTPSPTITTPAMTAAGILLGTAAYMSPEQARGRQADRRSDVWAFGCVLYEMLTGRRAFEGDDVSDTFAAVLRAVPDWSAIPPGTPPGVQRVIRRCLEKDPNGRYQAIADARLDLTELTAAPAPAVAPDRSVRERAGWVLIATVLVGAVIYLARGQTTPPRAVVRFQISPPTNSFFGSIGGIAGSTSGAAVSPDGTRLAFTATDHTGRTNLWLRPLESSGARVLAETEGAFMPFWSPDGRSLGFFASGKMKSIDVASGVVRVITDAAPGRGASWGSRDVIVFASGNPSQLARVSADGSGRSNLLADVETFGVRRQPLWPFFLPDGRHFIYFTRSQETEPGLMVASIDPGFRPRLLLPSDTAGAVMPPGRLLFARGGMLLQQRLDLDRLEVVGEPIPINEGILINQEAGLADFAVSPSGVLVYQSGTDGVNQFAWVDRQGKTVETVGARGRFRSFALSPDGQRLAYEDPTKGDIWILDVERQTSSRFTTTPGHEACPVWFPDGTKIAYRTNAGGVFVKEVSGTTVERRVADMFINGPSQFTPDGKALLCFWVPPDAQSQAVAVLPLTDKAAPQTIVRSAFANVEPQISPDGRWLAYASPESGRNEVYVQPFPPTGARWQVSSAGGRQPMWRGDSRELYFVADDRRFYAVDVTPGTHTFQCSAPHFLFEMRANVFNVRNSYLPRADGQQFLVNTLIENTGEPLNVVLNWQPR